MATASEERWRAGVEGPGFRATLKRVLDKPLTSYHLVLGVSGLLLSLGLLMVLSASSVTSLNEYGTSYAIFAKQAIWVVVGVPLALIASRLPIGLEHLDPVNLLPNNTRKTNA